MSIETAVAPKPAKPKKAAAPAKGPKSAPAKAGAKPSDAKPSDAKPAESTALRPAKATSPRPSRAEAADKKLQRAAMLLKQASDPTRLKILITLADGERNVGELCATLGQSQPACSHHLALLRHGSLISPRRQGKNNYYGLSDEGGALVDSIKGVIA